MQRLGCLAVLFAAAVCAATADAQSFNCEKAHYDDERLICDDQRLGRLDNQLNAVFGRVMARLSRAERNDLQRQEDRWVLSRRVCGANFNCIARHYRSRMDELSEMADENAAPENAGTDERRGGAGSRSAATERPASGAANGDESPKAQANPKTAVAEPAPTSRDTPRPAKSAAKPAQPAGAQPAEASKPTEASPEPAAEREQPKKRGGGTVAVIAPKPPARANSTSAISTSGAGSSLEPQVKARISAPPSIKWVDPLPDRP